MYTISLKLGDKTLEGKGATPVEALTSLPRPAKIMHKGELLMTYGKLKKQLLLTPPKVKRIFYNSVGVAEIIAKQLFAGLK